MAARAAQPKVINIGAVPQPSAAGSRLRHRTYAGPRFRRVVMALHQLCALSANPARFAGEPLLAAACAPMAARASGTPGGSPAAVQERLRLRQPYPHCRVIVLDDDVNTFQHVVESLVRHLPGMQPDQAWQLAYRIDGEGSAVVWRGPQEQAELYHQLLAAEGLTMAPLERD